MISVNELTTYTNTPLIIILAPLNYQCASMQERDEIDKNLQCPKNLRFSNELVSNEHLQQGKNIRNENQPNA